MDFGRLFCTLRDILSICTGEWIAKTLDAHNKLIRDIFEGIYQFEIPNYERPYAWTTEQATELFDDLVSAMQDARNSGSTNQYFLGSIVLIKDEEKNMIGTSTGPNKSAEIPI